MRSVKSDDAGDRSIGRRAGLTVAAVAALGLLSPASPGIPGLASATAIQTEADRIYRQGTEAIDAEEWQRAVDRFDRVIEIDEGRVDAALYWRAYALDRAGRPAEALETIRLLKRNRPLSNWLDDARALEVEIRQSSGQRLEPGAAADDELKLMILSGLMHSDDEQAIPMLARVLEGDHSLKVKERALFVLAQSGSPAALEKLVEVARGAEERELQLRAVRMLGIRGGEESHGALGEIYAASDDPEVKESVLHAFMVAGNTAELLEAARDEEDPGLRRAAIHQLGIMDASEELGQLYEAESEVAVKEAIVQALFLAGDAERVERIARTDADVEVREDAVHRLGLMDAVDRLTGLYEDEEAPEVRRRILHALFLAEAVEPLASLVRSEASEELRLEAIHRLGLIDGEASGRVLRSLYEESDDPDIRSRIVHSLWLRSDVAALIEIYEREGDPELRKQIVQRLSMSDSPEASKFLQSLLFEDDEGDQEGGRR